MSNKISRFTFAWIPKHDLKMMHGWDFDGDNYNGLTLGMLNVRIKCAMEKYMNIDYSPCGWMISYYSISYLVKQS